MISVILAKVLLYLLLNESAAGVVVYLFHFLWCCSDRFCDRLCNGLLLSDCHVSHSGGGLGRLSLHGWHHRSHWCSGHRSHLLRSIICFSMLTSPFICCCHFSFIPVVSTLLHNPCDASLHRTLYVALHFLTFVPA